MTELALASMFTGAVILIWGFRALRNHYVNVLFFKLHCRYSTWVFGFVATICGLLMFLTGLAAVNDMSDDLIESLVKSGLNIFALGCGAALIMEAIARIAWRLHPESKPDALRAKHQRLADYKPKRKGKASDMMDKDEQRSAAANDSAEAATSALQDVWS